MLLRLMPWLPAATEREAHFARLYSIWDSWIQHMKTYGASSEDDDSMWACISRVRDPATGAGPASHGMTSLHASCCPSTMQVPRRLAPENDEDGGRLRCLTDSTRHGYRISGAL